MKVKFNKPVYDSVVCRLSATVEHLSEYFLVDGELALEAESTLREKLKRILDTLFSEVEYEQEEGDDSED